MYVVFIGDAFFIIILGNIGNHTNCSEIKESEKLRKCCRMAMLRHTFAMDRRTVNSRI